MVSFIDKENWSDIHRGYEYEAVLPYPSDTKRPLSFFVPDSCDPERGRIVESIGNFRPVYVNGKPTAKEQKIVMTVKPRKVVVLTNDVINQNEDFEYILIAPINTIKPDEKHKDWYHKLVNDDHPIFTYIPKWNLERYVNLSQTMSIHKSLLLHKSDPIPDDRMKVIDDNLVQCLALGLISEDEVEEEKDIIPENKD
ncbi:PemK-like, MazF-like toxin of type II toxin-antitoxin system [Anoxybacillus vitaminiphilus]|uniref:PemK-like, MazF-like toxin of type II toxin-antitoxin system n=1 Tax=Paranoxybacillus vitaminiphilus TaxID=581036 RepID=A0A327Y1A0_9BACL|nr:type II toxin-antitoxin system PemK/MazF family toxin [Anoxybacillus vitaminiphilus]RAK14860.1 PemK-like, MazF-like toxin of type II toxin-antitoxin system [Anoxybacillus vitaminiphilus]